MKLLEPIAVGKTTFKNRLMFPPLTTGYEEKDGSIGEQSFRFYERLAKGGVGYIVIGDVAPLATFSPTPKLFSPAQAEGFKRLADACHENGAKLGIQLFHPDYNVAALNVLSPIRCKTLLDGGRRRTKNLYGVFKRTVPAGQVRQ